MCTTKLNNVTNITRKQTATNRIRVVHPEMWILVATTYLLINVIN